MNPNNFLTIFSDEILSLMGPLLTILMHRDILIVPSTVDIVSEKIMIYHYKLEFNMAQTIYAFDALLHIIEFTRVKFMREMWDTHVLSRGLISSTYLGWCKEGNEYFFSLNSTVI
jgi:hypothetical protein